MSKLLVGASYKIFFGRVGKRSVEALEDTINEFFKMTQRKEKWDETDFRCADPYDF